MIYCVSDIHGEYDKYIKLMDKIGLTDSDTLFVLGDVLDRGERPVDILRDMMVRPNVVPLMGNHELMALINLKFLLTNIDDGIDTLSDDAMRSLMDWQYDGGATTIRQFAALDRESRTYVAEYLREFSLYEEITVGTQTFLLCHSAPHDMWEGTTLDDYTPTQILFERPNYGKRYFDDKILVTGHTPTQVISRCATPGYIYKENGHIAIDCGATFGGRLGAICLDNGKEYYV